MNPVTSKQGSLAIVYDADVLPEADARLFDPGHWASLGRLVGTAPGRGTTRFVDAPFGPAVLRQYLRGGWPARLSSDRYLFTGLSRSRPFREFELLRRLREAGLGVPAPIAGLCRREGIAYRGALLTHRIEGARTLSERLTDHTLDWRWLGAALRRYHEAGVHHADLNARNILVGEATERLWLVDLDCSRFTPGKPVSGRGNLARLERSLRKLWPPSAPTLESRWSSLMEGYGA